MNTASHTGWMPSTSRLWRRVTRGGWHSHRVYVILAGAAVAAAVTLLDSMTVPGMTLGLFHLPVIMWVTWYAGGRAGHFQALVSALLWLAADLATATSGTPRASYDWLHCWNTLERYGIFLITVLVIVKTRRLHACLAAQVKDGSRALAVETGRRYASEAEAINGIVMTRRNISQSLHDGLGSYLAGISFRAKNLAENLREEGSPCSEEATDIVHHLNRAAGQCRNVARLLFTKEAPDGQGFCAALAAALPHLASAFQIECVLTGPAFENSCFVGCAACRGVRGACDKLCPVGPRLVLMVQEAIHNAAVHGHCSRVEMVVSSSPSQWEITIQDDGIGLTTGEHCGGGMGLRSMQVHAEAVGGHLETQIVPGRGCSLRCVVPLGAAARPLPDLSDPP